MGQLADSGQKKGQAELTAWQGHEWEHKEKDTRGGKTKEFRTVHKDPG